MHLDSKISQHFHPDCSWKPLYRPPGHREVKGIEFILANPVLWIQAPPLPRGMNSGLSVLRYFTVDSEKNLPETPNEPGKARLPCDIGGLAQASVIKGNCGVSPLLL